MVEMTVKATEARKRFGELISQVRYGDMKVIIERHGQKVVLISEEEYRRLNSPVR